MDMGATAMESQVSSLDQQVELLNNFLIAC